MYALSCSTGIAVLLAGCEPSAGYGDPSAGQALYLSRCQACHGERGEKSVDGGAGVVIRDLSAESIVETLKRYQDGVAGAPWWTALKSGLQDQEIRDLAAYFPLLVAVPAGG